MWTRSIWLALQDFALWRPGTLAACAIALALIFAFALEPILP